MDNYIYLAAPLFTRGERDFNSNLAQSLRARGIPVFLPQEECRGTNEEIFAICNRGIAGAKSVVAILDGADADSGTCWEVGYACQRHSDFGSADGLSRQWGYGGL